MGLKRRWDVLVGVALIGCGRLAEEPPSTGAKECAQGYYDALIEKDWPRAYALLDPQSQQRCNSQQFSRWAQSYRSDLGFDPHRVLVRACEEHGTEATAHIVLMGGVATANRRYRDTITLRRSDTWYVVLPRDFGRGRKR
jgi:hypothetical protein